MSARPIISPSILAADFARLGEEARAVQSAGADWLHLDVMDGHFVPNITIGPDVVKAIRPHVSIPLDVHLMIAPADPYLEAFREAGADVMSIHPEAGPHLNRSLQRIRELGAKAGVVFNPATPLLHMDYVMDKLDMVLLMSVNPGFGGQSFIPATLGKLREARARIAASGLPVRLEVDGGVGVQNIRAIAAAGADTFVAGSAIFNAPDYAAVIRQMRAELAQVEH